MFDYFKRKRIEKYLKNTLIYISQNLEDVSNNEEDFKSAIRFSLKIPSNEDNNTNNEEENLQINEIEDDVQINDTYNSDKVNLLMKNYSADNNYDLLSKRLNNIINKTFVESLIEYINKKGLKDSQVYKPAQIDRRLFSKIMSDINYKPSKDTVIAILIGLKLSLKEAKDMLSRAGYTLSHSSKKDIIIEYFFCEKIYNINYLNEILFLLGEKIIGR